MGAFNDYLVAQKGTLAGQIPIAGTFVGTSESVSLALIQQIKGAPMVLPDVAALADVPFELLQQWMEVTVSELMGVNRTKYVLYNMPPDNMKVNEVIGFTLAAYWQEVIHTAPVPVPGPPGDKGWSMVPAAESDGVERTVIKIIDWVGGTGTKPVLPAPALSYVGDLGFTNKTLAKNFQGAPGPSGASPLSHLAVIANYDGLVSGGTFIDTVTQTLIPIPLTGTLLIAPSGSVNQWINNTGKVVNVKIELDTRTYNDVNCIVQSSLEIFINLTLQKAHAFSSFVLNNTQRITLTNNGIMKVGIGETLGFRGTLTTSGGSPATWKYTAGFWRVYIIS